MQRRLGGVIVPLVTPLDERGSVSEACVHRLIDSVRSEVTALMPALSSGEGWKLSDRQWIDMVRHVQEYADGLPVLVGIELGDTPSVVARARTALRFGVDAIVVAPPYAEGISQQEILDHYRVVRGDVDMPLVVYNTLGTSWGSGNRIELDTLLRICELPGVVGVKESSGSAAFTRELIARQTAVPVFQGWEHLLLDTPSVAGCVVPLANLEPGVCSAMHEAPSTGLQARISALCNRYGLLRDDWYLQIKRELQHRGVIENVKIVETARTA